MEYIVNGVPPSVECGLSLGSVKDCPPGFLTESTGFHASAADARYSG